MKQVRREQGIGASEVPVIAGCSPWNTPAGLWLQKVGMAAADRPDTAQMAAGRALEGSLLKLGGDQAGVAFRRNRQRIAHPSWPDVPLYATPDGWDIHRTVLAEVKLVGHHFDDWTSQPPEYVRLQVQAQLACVPSAHQAHVIALVGGTLRTYVLTADPVAQEQIPQLVADWWRDHVVGQRAPEASTPDDAWALLKAGVVSNRAERLATPDEQRAGQRLLALLADKQRLDALIDEERLALAATAADVDVAGLGWSARWSYRSSVDWKALASALAVPQDVLDSYTRRSSVFSFRRLGDPA